MPVIFRSTLNKKWQNLKTGIRYGKPPGYTRFQVLTLSGAALIENAAALPRVWCAARFPERGSPDAPVLSEATRVRARHRGSSAVDGHASPETWLDEQGIVTGAPSLPEARRCQNRTHFRQETVKRRRRGAWRERHFTSEMFPLRPTSHFSSSRMACGFSDTSVL